MNVTLLRTIQQRILDEPRRLNMDVGIAPSSVITGHAEEPPCGTICCIAGETLIAADMYKDIGTYTEGVYRWTTIESRAQALLELTDSQARSLFHTEWWPHIWHTRLTLQKPGTEFYARIASDYIDWFIEVYA